VAEGGAAEVVQPAAARGGLLTKFDEAVKVARAWKG
jgi:hypothetical protein